MAFTGFEEKDPKIQCPISREAHSVLVNDNLAFVLDDYRDDEYPVKPGRSGDGPSTSFLNRILCNFYPEAQASIGRRLYEYQEELEYTLGKLSGKLSLTKKDKERIIDEFMNEKEKRLKDYVKNLKPKKMEKLKPRLQFNLYDSEQKGEFCKYITGRKLEGDGLECEEDNYYKRRQNQYITALLEEYAHLPFIERERIFFKDRFKLINEAIKKHCLKITFYTGNGNKKVHIVQPYAIKTDPKQTTSYIVGYSYEENNEQSELRPCSFNIVNIAHCASCTDPKYSLTDKQIADLVDIIDKYGVQFIAGDKLTIQARFTKEGLRKYKRIPILRPLPKLNKNEKFEDKTPEDIIQFECSEYQAKNYFLRLGEDVIILSPPKLRKYFSDMYHAAAASYDNE